MRAAASIWRRQFFAVPSRWLRTQRACLRLIVGAIVLPLMTVSIVPGAAVAVPFGPRSAVAVPFGPRSAVAVPFGPRSAVAVPGDSEVGLSGRCGGNRGVLVASITNRGSNDATYALRANTLAPRRLVLAPGATGDLKVGGVADGAWNLRLNENGVRVASTTLTIECDPTDDETGVIASCMAARGRVDVYLRNHETAPREVTVTVNNAGRDYERLQSVASDSVDRVTVTGLRDGPVAVTVRGITVDGVDGFRFRAVIGCGPGADEPVGVVSIDPTRVDELVHETSSFTQGLTFTTDGRLFESSGAYRDQTRVREIDPATGTVLREVGFGTGFFGEGLAAVGDRLWLLSWREGVVRVLDQDTFAIETTHRYDGEGWGLCFDGATLVRSDGTSHLYRHRLSDFAVIETIQVTKSGQPVTRLNELECVDGSIWANVWYSDEAIRIDARSGAVDGIVDMSALERPRPSDSNAVANGIAYDPTTANLWLTGKFWTTYSRFEVPSF